MSLVWHMSGARAAKLTSCSACGMSFGIGGGSTLARCPIVVVKDEGDTANERLEDIPLDDPRVLRCDRLVRSEGSRCCVQLSRFLAEDMGPGPPFGFDRVPSG